MVDTQTNGTLFNEFDSEETEEEYCFVKLVRGKKGKNHLSGQPTFTAYVRDFGKLPAADNENANALKAIVFVHKKFAREIINKTGFKDAQGSTWFAMAIIDPSANEAYWVRNVDPLLVEFANDNKAKALEEINKMYEQ